MQENRERKRVKEKDEEDRIIVSTFSFFCHKSHYSDNCWKRCCTTNHFSPEPESRTAQKFVSSPRLSHYLSVSFGCSRGFRRRLGFVAAGNYFFLLLCRWSRASKKRREQRTRACDSPWQKNGESALNFARPCNRWASLSLSLSLVQRRDWWKCRGFLARGGDLPGSGKNIPEREKLI